MNMFLMLILVIVYFIAFFKFLKWGFNSFLNDEVTEDFGFKNFFASYGLIFWINLLGGIMSLYVNSDKIELFNENTNIKYGVFAVAIIVSVLLPIKIFSFWHKHKKILKEKKHNQFTYKQLSRKHFFMGFTAPFFATIFAIPFVLKFLFSGDETSNSNSDNSGYTKMYSSYRDTEGKTHYTDTIIDNETGIGSVRHVDGNGKETFGKIFRH